MTDNSTELATRPSLPEKIEQALVQGNLEALDPAERVKLYHETCRSLGLNPLTKPFDYLKLNGRLLLYATRNCTDQLRAIQHVTLTISHRERLDDIYIVTARATTPDGRADESTGAVTIAGLKGDLLCNALMKAETKAKRRVTLSIVGLSMMDETETETVPQATKVSMPELDRPPLPAPDQDYTDEVPEDYKAQQKKPRSVITEVVEPTTDDALAFVALMSAAPDLPTLKEIGADIKTAFTEGKLTAEQRKVLTATYMRKADALRHFVAKDDEAF